MKLEETIEAIGRSFEEFKAANDERLKALEEKGSVDPLLTEKIEKINADITDLLKTKERLDALESKIATIDFPGGGASDPKAKAKAEYKAAFENWFRKGVDAGLNDLAVRAEMSTLSDPDGGFLVPEEFDKLIVRVTTTVSAMRKISSVITIGTDTYKKLINKGGTASGWVAEKGSRSTTATPSLEEIVINTKELYAQPAATQKLLDDSYIDIGAWLASEVTIEFAEQEGDAFINGNGVEKPHGINNYPKVANSSYTFGKIGYVVSGNASALDDPDALIALQHALKSVYRNGAVWLMSDSTFEAIRKLKDGNGAYLWRPGLAEGEPTTLLGKPVAIDDNCDDIGSNNYPVFFGNFKRGYLIVDRMGTRVLRDPYTSKPYVLFYTTKRVGGGVVMHEAIKALKIAA